jgi:ribosomal protein S17E
MGKIKTKLIKRTSKEICSGGVEISTEFEKNKKLLVEGMPSKKVRNQIAGCLTKIAKNKKKEAETYKIN